MIEFLFSLLAVLTIFALAVTVAWWVITAWAWLERSDAEKGWSFRQWLRIYRKI